MFSLMTVSQSSFQYLSKRHGCDVYLWSWSWMYCSRNI